MTAKTTLFCFFLTFVALMGCKGPGKQRSLEEKRSPASEIRRVDAPVGMVTCGHLDRSGKIWFGTAENGLYQVDGALFLHFPVEESGCGPRISCITEDDGGRLWLGMSNGICLFDGEDFLPLDLPKYQISTPWLEDTYPAVNPNEVQAILQDQNGNFWIGTNGNGAFHYDGTTFTSHLTKVGRKQVDSLHHNIIQSISEDQEGNIWFTSMTHGGAHRFDGTKFEQFLVEDGLSDDMLRKSLVDRQGKIWFGFNGNRNSGLTCFDGQEFHTWNEEDGLCSKNIRALFEDEEGHIWLGGMQGLCIFDGEKFTSVPGAEGQTFDQIMFIVGDANQNIWFGGRSGFWKSDGISVERIS